FKEGQFNDTTDFGSPGYASPEQYEGIGQTDARSDLFSLGVIMHEMLSGQHPTRRGVTMELLESLHKLNPGISPALSGLVMVATRAEPMYRFQSAHTFYQALERVRSVEERRSYRYHTLVGEISATQKTPAFPLLIPPPSSQGFVSDELVRDQDQRAQHMRMREQSQRSTPRANLEQEALVHQLTSIDASLKLRAIASPLVHSAPPPALLSTFNLSSAATVVERVSPPAAPDMSSPLSPTPQAPPLALRKRSRRGMLILSLCILFILISGTLFAYHYVATHALSHHPQPRGTLLRPASSLTAQPTIAPTEPPVAWQSLPALPSVEADNTALYVRVQGQAFIYLSGGFRGAQATPNYSQGLYRYNIAGAVLEKVNVANFPGMGNNAAALDEQWNLFFTGGYSP
ncbi:MAG: hypothetical protein ACRDHW_16885, partial [Ktedonobacteraceae bacterium]